MEDLFNPTLANFTPVHAFTPTAQTDIFHIDVFNTSIQLSAQLVSTTVTVNADLKFDCVLMSVSLLCFAICGLFSLVKANRFAHVFVVHFRFD